MGIFSEQGAIGQARELRSFLDFTAGRSGAVARFTTNVNDDERELMIATTMMGSSKIEPCIPYF